MEEKEESLCKLFSLIISDFLANISSKSDVPIWMNLFICQINPTKYDEPFYWYK